MKPISIYIHIPFCKRKCLYCDFPSFAGCEAEYDAYVSALLAEIRERSEDLRGYRVQTIFFGGGTPTVLPPKVLGKIIDTIHSKYDVGSLAEITTESNPGTLNKAMLVELAAMHFNRLSMGVQAWQNHLLQRIGRIHTIEEFLDNYATAREVGFQNINVDLMFSLPGQTFLDWEETLEKIIRLKPEHISAYSLIIEEGTPFHEMYAKGVFTLPDEKLDREMYTFTKEFLQGNGYHQYEISNFAKEGKESRHNKVYWRDEEYIGFGLGAHSYFRGERFHNTYDMKQYISGKGDARKLVEERETLAEETQIEEFMFMGLRMTEGIENQRFLQRFGKNIHDVFQEEVEYLVGEKLLWEKDGFLRLTDRGMDLSNFVFEKFLL